MKRKIVFVICVFMAIVPTVIYTQTMSDYCSVSPFVTRTVPPNITMILDNSATMLAPAYPLTDHYESSNPNSYIGYFDPQVLYCSATGLFYETSGNCEADDGGPYPGALLNWATMSKYDVLMHTLMGGLGASNPDSPDLSGDSLNRGWIKTTPRYPGCQFIMSDDSLFITGTGCTLQNPATKIIVRNGRKARGLIPEIVDKNNDGAWDKLAPRIAVMGFDPSQYDITMAYCIGGTNSLHSLYGAIARGAPDEMNLQAPLGKAVVRTIEFYKNSCSVCDTCPDPIDTMHCRKNFVVSMSSGDDTDIPSVYPAEDLHDRIRNAHTSDIRADLQGTQVIQFFNINIFGSPTGKDILKGISKYGGFVDMNGNKLPDLNSEWDRDGDGLPDTYFETADVATLRSSLEKAFSDISAQAASGTAVSVFTGSAGKAGGSIQAHFLPVREDGARKVMWTGYIRNIWADPDRNLRDDSVHDYKLILDQDRIVKFFFHEESNRTKAALFTTLSDGSGGTFSSCSNPEIRESAHINSLWEAGGSLALREPSARIIFTSKKIIRGNAVRTFSETPYPLFERNMNPVLLGALNPDATYAAGAIVGYIRGECLETGVSGDAACSSTHDPGFRDRRITINGIPRVWKLGDIMASTPKAFTGVPLNAYHVDYADRSYYDYIADNRYRSKSSIVFAGANDGMLHAFRGGYLRDRGLTANMKALLKDFFSSGDNEHDRLGEEIWAYIPFNAFPYLKYLADPYYCHINYNDLSVRVFDVSFHGGAGAVRERNSWKTILLGGMRFGGACGTGGNPADPPSGTPSAVGYSSYFALDVTVPERPVPLWEFSDDDMGYAVSAPAIVRIGDRVQNGEWYVVLGSGSKMLPREGTDIGRSGPGYVYILDLRTGEVVKKITLARPAIVGDIVAVDADRDYETEKVYFGTSCESGGAWMGEVLSLHVPAVLAASGVNMVWNSSFGKVLFSGKYPFTASPEVAKDAKGNIWVYAGSGKYFSDVDETDVSQQIVFGLRDRNNLIGEAALYDATDVLTRGEVTGHDRVCAYDSGTNSFGIRDIVTSVKPSTTPLTAVEPGWKIYLSGGERVISRPAAVGGNLDFLTYEPDQDPCAYGGDSFLYSVGCTTGIAPSHIAIRSPDITTGASGQVTVHKSIHLGSGAPPAGDAIMMQPATDESGHLQKKIQIATGMITEAGNQPLYSIVAKIVHWLKK